MRALNIRKILFLLTFVLCMTGCSESSYSKDFFLMDTVMSITAYGKNAKTAIEQSIKRIEEIEKTLSRTDEESDIYKLNRNSGQAMKVREDTLKLLAASCDLSTKTGGKFDVTLARVTELWDIMSDDPQVPEEEDIESALVSVGTGNIYIDGGEVTFRNNTMVDLGAIAKGYAADEAVGILRNNGISKAMLSLGGNVYVLGDKDKNKSFNVGIADPEKPSDYVGYISLKDMAVVTSGSYERSFIKDGILYHHIIDPDTGFPADSDLLSVSIIANQSYYADALSTALFVMGSAQGLKFYEKYEDFEAIFVTKSKEIICTEGLKGRFVFSLEDKGYRYAEDN